MPPRLTLLSSRHADRVTLGVQGLIVDENRHILLVRHGYRPGWHFPGGGVERNESIDRALCRELDEEAGVAIVQPPKLFGIYTNFEVFPGDHVVLFVVEYWRQNAIPKPNAEIAEQGFFALDDLPDMTTAPTRRRLDEVFLGDKRTPSW